MTETDGDIPSLLSRVNELDTEVKIQQFQKKIFALSVRQSTHLIPTAQCLQKHLQKWTACSDPQEKINAGNIIIGVLILVLRQLPHSTSYESNGKVLKIATFPLVNMLKLSSNEEAIVVVLEDTSSCFSGSCIGPNDLVGKCLGHAMQSLAQFAAKHRTVAATTATATARRVSYLILKIIEGYLDASCMRQLEESSFFLEERLKLWTYCVESFVALAINCLTTESMEANDLSETRVSATTVIRMSIEVCLRCSVPFARIIDQVRTVE